MNAIDFNKAITASFAKYFPNGFIDPTKLSLDNGTHFTVGMIGKDGDQLHNRSMNDLLTIRFAIEALPFEGNTELGDTKMAIEFNGSTLCVRSTNPHKAMDRVKIPCRRIINTPEKALAALDKYFAKVHEVVKAQADANNLYKQEEIKAEYLPA
ncbi:hypothetical protein ACTG16_23555 [Aeromonas sp. 23P]|uniref:hypothetical protein n=1 Tax=Aeromonas sp. 23P TaxID=3452716 RepID=UPI003F79E120